MDLAYAFVPVLLYHGACLTAELPCGRSGALDGFRHRGVPYHGRLTKLCRVQDDHLRITVTAAWFVTDATTTSTPSASGFVLHFAFMNNHFPFAWPTRAVWRTNTARTHGTRFAATHAGSARFTFPHTAPPLRHLLRFLRSSAAATAFYLPRYRDATAAPVPRGLHTSYTRRAAIFLWTAAAPYALVVPAVGHWLAFSLLYDT